MTASEGRTQIVQLVALIVLSTFLLAAISIAGFYNQHGSSQRDHSILSSQATTSARTECRARRNAALDQARWDAVSDLVQATSRDQAHFIGLKLKSFPTSIELANKGGTINGVRFDPCPAPPKVAKP